MVDRVGGLVLLACIATGPAAAAGAEERPELTVYAAASLRDALAALGATCEETAQARLVFNFGASSDLARQIVAAHKADIFFSADEDWMDRVAEQGLVDRASRRSPLSNRLVLVAPLDGRVPLTGPAALVDPAVKRIAVADPATVPAGKYARAWLEETGRWAALQEKVVPALDVRAVLAAVEAGAVDAGVVYRTDAAISTRVRIVYEVPESEGPPIAYAVAVLDGRPHQAAARRMLDCLTGAAALPAYATFGFVVEDRVR